MNWARSKLEIGSDHRAQPGLGIGLDMAAAGIANLGNVIHRALSRRHLHPLVRGLGQRLFGAGALAQHGIEPQCQKSGNHREQDNIGHHGSNTSFTFIHKPKRPRLQIACQYGVPPPVELAPLPC